MGKKNSPIKKGRGILRLEKKKKRRRRGKIPSAVINPHGKKGKGEGGLKNGCFRAEKKKGGKGVNEGRKGWEKRKSRGGGGGEEKIPFTKNEEKETNFPNGKGEKGTLKGKGGGKGNRLNPQRRGGKKFFPKTLLQCEEGGGLY